MSFRLKVGLLVGLVIGLAPVGVWAVSQPVTSGQPQARQLVQHPIVSAFSQLAQSQNGGKGNLAGGCADLAGQRACVPAVTLDGQRLSDMVVLAKLVGVTGEPGAVSTSLSSPQEINTAIAAAVFDHLLYVQGVQDGFSVSNDQAKAFAQQQLANYLRDPQPAAIPAGMSPQGYFLSPSVITTYGRGMVVADEREKITAGLPAGTDSTPTYRTWLTGELQHHSVTVNGAPPAFSLPNALPERP